jgi:hypothetical protein
MPRSLLGNAILAGGLFGGLLLIAAELTPLFEVHAANVSAPVKSVSTGSHNAYALIPLGVLAAGLAWGVRSAGSRPALLALGLVGLIALLIALLGDLPDAHATGLIGNGQTHYVNASSTPSTGLYLETLGAVVLVITSVSGFVLLGPPPRQQAPQGPREARPRSAS